MLCDDDYVLYDEEDDDDLDDDEDDDDLDVEDDDDLPNTRKTAEIF